ncbi:hypothetical protein BK816_06635 [Boudabousia tangfeifanii]|uniref:Sensory transduction regulator n=1 Tax=Boudabousia tangfeifanii TaxID=1912795 RepID=A0A1D9MLF1_9ACTO|nr:hypothetical protein [Boudabousia tangfeifanii]AOZ73003.1 hypothetical protein BK816_06635 [Boudabousia tangfeifanii]
MSNEITHVTLERMKAALKELGYEVGEQQETLFATFNEFPVIIRKEMAAPFLLVRGWLPEPLPPSSKDDILLWIEGQHQAEYFPKSFVDNTEGGLDFFAEVYQPIMSGMNDEQLKLMVETALESVVARLTHATRRFSQR